MIKLLLPKTMVALGGFVLSGGLGLITRKLQVSIIGKTYPNTYNRVFGYLLSAGFFMGGYTFFSGIVDNNRSLLDRRLTILREQRAKQELFNEFTENPDHRMTADKRQGKLFDLFDKFGAKYK